MSGCTKSPVPYSKGPTFIGPIIPFGVLYFSIVSIFILKMRSGITPIFSKISFFWRNITTNNCMCRKILIQDDTLKKLLRRARFLKNIMCIKCLINIPCHRYFIAQFANTCNCNDNNFLKH